MVTATEMETADTDEGVIHLPYKFTPRDYQKPVMDAVMLGYKRIACPWHRRAGKDKTFLNIIIRATPGARLTCQLYGRRA